MEALFANAYESQSKGGCRRKLPVAALAAVSVDHLH
jgi:hypothetical protein